MTNYLILVLCVIIILSYLFDISGKYSKIPGVIFLIALGIGLQYLLNVMNIVVPNLKPVLPVIGTIGLIMIVMDASLDLRLERRKKKLIIRSVSSAAILFGTFSGALAWILTEFFDVPLRDALLNSISVGIISSSIAIPAAQYLKSHDREFVVYESSFSDIIGIIVFDFILGSQGSMGSSISTIVINFFITVLIAVLTSFVLATLLHKITYHVNYVIIMTCIILVYVLAKMAHLPALLLVLIFGLILSNNHLFERDIVKKYIDFEKFRVDIKSFKTILTEFTFLVRSIFFILFGFYIKTEGLFDPRNLVVASSITAVIFLLRLIFLKQVLRMDLVPLLFYSPRGLITILLFLSIPPLSRTPLVSEEVITLVILFTILILVLGSLMVKRDKAPEAEMPATGD